ncbi:MAG: FAD-dependent oxidoreductase [Lachnospiraceae bacterium]|jgi:fumarate reductase flavoprotein subunit|nr:FAD-dependent oxidoreductase [Lachnospiraceae bacterium]
MKKLETDVVIVGAGPSGLAASVQAADDGASVIVLNKADVVGGAANMGMGPLGIGTRQQQAQMVDIDVERAFKMFMDYTHWRVDANLVKKYFENSKETIEWLEDMGVEFAGAYPYFPKSEATWHIVAVNGGIGRNGGAIMNKAMMDKGTELGVEYMNSVEVQEIVIEDGKVAGVKAKAADGEEIEVSAKAVIIATGGAGDSPEYLKERMGYTWGEDMFNFRIPGNVGDGIKMAIAAGAATTEMNMEMIYVLPNTDMIEPLPAVFMQPNLMVNQFGRRFINEEQMQNTTFTGNAINIQKGSVGYSIFDSSILKGYKKRGLDVVNFVHHPENLDEFDEVLDAQIAGGNKDVYMADTIEELAEKLGIDPEALSDTIDEYNDMCDSADTQFYKPRKFMKPIRKAPFYAGAFRPSGYGTLGGIKVNDDMEVLKDNWEKIPGLYACGTDTCTIYGDSYMFLLPGNTMGYCLNSGRFAGEGAAAYADEN